MNRRQLLGLLAAAPVALIVPELLVPKRTFFLPPAGGWDLGAESVTSFTEFNFGELTRYATISVVEYVCVKPGVWQRIGRAWEPAVPPPDELRILEKKAAVPGAWVRYYGYENSLLSVTAEESELYLSRSIEDVKIA
jgi:hypothetical protein